MNRRDGYSGFTLIELLVVIAIIGVLASVVLASLNSARSKGRDAAIQSNLNAVRTQAELIYNDYGCYTGTGLCPSSNEIVTVSPDASVCTSANNHLECDTTVNKQLVAAINASGGLISLQEPGGGGAYAYAIQLVSDPALAWCIDSLGNSKLEGTKGGTALTQTTLNAFISNYSTCN